MKIKLCFFPQYAQGLASNPYCDNYLGSINDYFRVILKSKYTLPRGFEFLLNSTKAELYVINWLEGISSLRCGWIQAIVSIMALIIIKIRKGKIIWMFHNIHPHDGENFWSKLIQRFLFTHSYLIISHSEEAAEYARLRAKCPVVFRHHPMIKKEYPVWTGDVKDCDFYIWGDIYPYKGIVELLKSPACKNSKAFFLIVGKPTSQIVEKQIIDNLTENVLFENRRADYGEIAAQCKKAKYVLFPYVGESISSSGVLMDTLLMGGIPVGPNHGAFYDLAKHGCCITYNDINELSDLPLDDSHRLQLDENNVSKFISDNSWESYGKWFAKMFANPKNDSYE